MENERELLVLAAKSCGIKCVPYFSEKDDFLCMVANDGTEWNPLTDDGDALRLAVKLQLGISIPPVVDGRIEVVTFYGPIISIVEHPKNDDRNAATRRAIVRAAAEVGRTMQSDER